MNKCFAAMGALYDRAIAKFSCDKSEIPIIQTLSRATRRKMKGADWAMFALNDFPGLIGLLMVVLILFVILFKELA